MAHLTEHMDKWQVVVNAHPLMNNLITQNSPNFITCERTVSFSIRTVATWSCWRRCCTTTRFHKTPHATVKSESILTSLFLFCKIPHF
jgi:hypothetical protein